jgi:hypothetical protein
MPKAIVEVSLKYLTLALRGELPHWAWTDAPNDLKVIGSRGFDPKRSCISLIVESELFPLIGVPYMDGMPQVNFNYQTGPVRPQASVLVEKPEDEKAN